MLNRDVLVDEMRQRWFRRQCRAFLHRVTQEDLPGVTPEAVRCAVTALGSDAMVAEFADECVGRFDPPVGGPIGDVLKMILQSFLDDPEKWIRILLLLFGG